MKVGHSPYSPDLVRNEFIFLEAQTDLQGRNFENTGAEKEYDRTSGMFQIYQISRQAHTGLRITKSRAESKGECFEGNWLLIHLSLFVSCIHVSMQFEPLRQEIGRQKKGTIPYIKQHRTYFIKEQTRKVIQFRNLNKEFLKLVGKNNTNAWCEKFCLRPVPV